MTARPKSFDEMLVREMPRISGYARSLCRDRHAAQDLAQTVAVRALAAWEQFRPGTNFGAWLTTICRNAFLDAARTGTRLTFLDDMTGLEGRNPAQSCEAQMIAREAVAMLPGVVGAETMRLFDLVGSGFEKSEIAERLAIAEGTAGSRLHRARARLRLAGLSPC